MARIAAKHLKNPLVVEGSFFQTDQSVQND